MDFSSESAVLIRWPKYWSFSFSIIPSNEYSRLISLKMTALISLLPKGRSEVFSSTTVWRHQFFRDLPSLQSSSYNCACTGKTVAFTIWTFVARVMSLLFNTLSRFVSAFLPRSNRLLTLWLQSPSTVILELKKRKSVTTSTFPLLFAMILVLKIFSLKLLHPHQEAI